MLINNEKKIVLDTAELEYNVYQSLEQVTTRSKIILSLFMEV